MLTVLKANSVKRSVEDKRVPIKEALMANENTVDLRSYFNLSVLDDTPADTIPALIAVCDFTRRTKNQPNLTTTGRAGSQLELG